MTTIETIKFSNNYEVKLKQIEETLIPIYLQVYNWNFKPKSFKDRQHYTKELINSDIALVIKDGKDRIGYVAFEIKNVDELKYIHVVEIEILKEHRKKGYAKLLLEKLYEQYKPDIVYGEAQNPISPKSLNDVYRERGYYTYWALEPIDPTFPITANIDKYSRRCIEIFDFENLKSYKNGVKEFTLFTCDVNPEMNTVPELEHIFNKIQKVSQTEYSSAFGVLICIRKVLI